MKTENGKCECLEVDEQTLAAIVVLVEELEGVCLESVDSIDAIDRFVGIESSGECAIVPETKCEGDREEENQQDQSNRSMLTEVGS